MKRLLLIALAFALASSALRADSGTQGAAFLNIPAGAEPAALGAAYSALATDVYAPIWNPAGLARLTAPEIGGQHLAYLDSIRYEYAGAVLPLKGQQGLGASIQYLTSGDIAGTDNSDNNIGNYSTHYGAYSLAYGRAFGDRLSLGITGKLINAAISDVSSTAYGLDLGSLYQLSDHITLAGTLTNLGSRLTFLSDGDPLPLAGHLGAAFTPDAHWTFSGEGVYRRGAPSGVNVGAQWSPLELFSIRTGYRTDTLKGLSPLAGVSTGIGLHVWNCEFSYAFLPYGDLGVTQYFSLSLRFADKTEREKNVLQHENIRHHQNAQEIREGSPDDVPDFQQLMQLYDEKENPPVAKSGTPAP